VLRFSLSGHRGAELEAKFSVAAEKDNCRDFGFKVEIIDLALKSPFLPLAENHHFTISNCV
jgi:hypothetical protein